MDTVKKVAKGANIVPVERDGLVLIRHADAAAFLIAATEAEARILAIDGFVLENDQIYADQAAECDLTDFDDLEDLAAEAEDFLDGFGPADDLYWDFVLDED